MMSACLPLSLKNSAMAHPLYGAKIEVEQLMMQWLQQQWCI